MSNGSIEDQEHTGVKTSRFRSWIDKYIPLSDFALPVRAWDSNQHIIASIVIASLFINALALVFPLVLLQMYDRIIPNQSVSTLFWLVFLVLLTVILSGILRVMRSYVGAWADAKFEHIIGTEAFEQILKSDLSVYEKEGSGRQLKRMNSLNMLRDFYSGQALVILIDIPFILIFLLLIVYIGGALVIVPILMIVFALWSTLHNTEKLQTILKERQDHDDRRLNFIVEMITRIHTIKSNTMEAQMQRRYERLQKASSLFDYQTALRGSYLLTDGFTLSQLTIVLVAAYGSIMVFNGHITLGALAACTLLAGRCLQPINSLISVWSRLQSIKVAREELNKVFEMPIETGGNLVKKIKGELEFENVSFSYGENNSLLIKNFNLKIHPKEAVCISGEGLSGKSTLMWMILGFIKPTKGRVLIDGEPVSEYDLTSLRTQIGYMPHNGVLFQGTILENLTMFDDKLENEAIQAAEAVGLSAIVEHLPDGYDTYVGNQAAQAIARGVAQRIIIARALIHNPQIILFDEANISLDMDGDKKIRELLEKLSQDRTILMISHRPSIIKIAKKHYLLQAGSLRLLDEPK
jgi:ATP-binding cassette subfamily C protein LapB